MDKRLKINKDKKNEMVEKLVSYFLEERDEHIGELGASLLLDYVIQLIGPEIYNNSIKDCMIYLNDRIEDMYGLEIRKR